MAFAIVVCAISVAPIRATIRSLKPVLRVDDSAKSAASGRVPATRNQRLSGSGLGVLLVGMVLCIVSNFDQVLRPLHRVQVMHHLIHVLSDLLSLPGLGEFL